MQQSMRQSPHPHIQLVSGEMNPFVASLRSKDGNGVCLVGGAMIAAQLLAARLLDELVVKVNPLVMGAGIRLFLTSAALHTR